MSKQSETSENNVFKGNLTVVKNTNAEDFGPGNIECEGTVYTDIIMENTTNLGVNLEGTKFIDNYYTLKDTTSVPSPSNSGENNIYIENGVLKRKNISGIVKIYNPSTTKGDLITHNGVTDVILPVGTDTQILSSDSVSSQGLKWITPTGFINFYIRDEKTQGSNGGTATSGLWIQRVLNTISSFPSTSTRVNLSLNNITFTPGTYLVEIQAPAYSVNNHTCRLFNVTDNLVTATGTTEYSSTQTILGIIVNSAISWSRIKRVITFTKNTITRVEHRIQDSQSNTGFGIATGFQVETYTTVNIAVII